MRFVGLLYLKLGHSFNCPLDSLPPTIVTIEFTGIIEEEKERRRDERTINWFIILESSNFNQSIDKLPPSLTTLKLLSIYNKPIASLISPSLTHLELGPHFSHPVDSLPPSLIHLTFGTAFNCPTNQLPHGLLFLKYVTIFFSSFFYYYLCLLIYLCYYPSF